MKKSSFLTVLTIITMLLPFSDLSAQTDKPNENVLLHPDRFYRKYLPGLKIKRNPPDSLYIKTYPYYLTAGLHVFTPGMRIDFAPKNPLVGSSNSNSKFKSSISEVVGIVLSYRFVSAGFAFLPNSGMNSHAGYTPSKYKTATIKFSSAGYQYQFKYTRVKGFTDTDQPNSALPDMRYTQRPDLLSKEFNFEFIHNFSWRKYSYIAPLVFTQRQVKSHGGFLLKGNIFYNQLSGDSSIIARQRGPNYGRLNGVNVFRSLSLRIAPGAGGTIVINRRMYFSISAFTSFDLYLYKYLQTTTDQSASHQALVFILEGKASLGYQTKRFYGGIRYEPERRAASLKDFKMTTSYSYLGVDFGYRLNAPAFVKKFYKKTMPPGM